MARIYFESNPLTTCGDLPSTGSLAPDFILADTDLNDLKRSDFQGRRLVLNIFLSVDTEVCAMSMRRFNSAAAKLSNTTVLCVSMDLPFAFKRFCGAEGLENVTPVSAFRSPEFGRDYGVCIEDGPLRGLLARAVVIINEAGKVIYTEQVTELTHEPDYDAALRALS